MINASIVLFNTPTEEVERVVSELLKSSLIEKLFLIDNSPYENSNYKKISDKRCSYIFTGENLGYGKGHNIGLVKSIEEKQKYHLVLNSDVIFKNEILLEIKDYMNSRKEVGLVCPKVLNINGTNQRVAKVLPSPFDLIIRGFIPQILFQKKRKRFTLENYNYQHELNVPYLSGCFMFLRVDTLKKIGIFDERFFMYPEDLDLTRRIHRHYHTILNPNVQIFHEHGKESFKSLKMKLIHSVNMIKYFNKWGWIVDTERIRFNKSVQTKLTKNEI